MFDTCQRLFYYRQMGRGMGSGLDDHARELFVLKRLTPFKDWCDGMVYSALAAYLIGEWEPEKMVLAFQNNLEQQFMSSREKSFLRPGAIRNLGIAEHYYDDRMDESDLEEAKKKLKDCLLAFGGTTFKKAYKDTKRSGRYAHVDDPDNPEMSRMTFQSRDLGNWVIQTRLDYVITVGSGITHIARWILDDPPADIDEKVFLPQHALNAMWAQDNINVPVENLRVWRYFLPSKKQVGGQITSDKLEELDNELRKMARTLIDFLGGESGEQLTENDFEGCGKKELCGNCQFRAVCPVKVW